MTAGPESSTESPARILIVDDEPLNVDYLEQELDGHGFVVETATDGLEALERVAANPPDLVLLDVMMPRLDGISALRILREDPETRLIPVVLMTALNAVEDRVRGIEAGADDFLSKPVDDRELLARIRTALGHKRAIDETVSELRSTSEHLERYGTQVREVAVLAVDLRLRDSSLPAEAVGFLGRRLRESVEERIRAAGGTPSENRGSLIVAVFDGPDLRSRSLAAVEAALAVLADSRDDSHPRVVLSAAIGVGPAQVGSIRERRVGETRWVFGVDGPPVDNASTQARDSSKTGVLVSGDVAGVLSDCFRLEPAGNGVFRVLSRTGGEQSDPAVAAADRRIGTILVTDIVGSTRTVEYLGDRAWAELLAEHDCVARRELALHGGVEIDTTGDGFLISFDSPARGVRCALSLVECLAELGLAIRAGIHTGEVELVDGEARGIAVHLASRIASKASSGEILVSATTRELAAGAGILFADRGEHTLRGVTEPRRLYAAVDEHMRRSLAPRELGSDDEDYPAGLTAREVDVIRLVAMGHTDAEVAERLVLSVRTVNAHLRSIYRKAGVGSRTAAARFAEENNLL
jgi:DNA-binding NarL/FixJ family response regulator